MEKPTLDGIKGKFKAYEKYYDKLHSEQRAIDDYYELVFEPGVPENYTTRMPPTARDWIDVGVRHFTLDNPKAKVFLRGESEAARKQADKLEALYNFWLRAVILKIKEAAKKLLLRGEVFLEIDMDDTYFGSKSPDRLYHFPLIFNVIDPINMYASPAHNGLVPVDIIKSYSITVAEAEEMCRRNDWKWETKKATDALVNWKVFRNADWRCFLLEDKPVLPDEIQPSLLKFCNYVHIGAGAGQESYEGKPEYKYRSLLWAKQDMLKLEAKMLSVVDAINTRYAFPRIKIKGDPEVIKKLYPHGVPTDPDQFWYEIEGQAEIEILQGEQPPSGIFQEYAYLQGQSQPPQVLAGVRPTGVYSGQHQESLIATAKPIYKDAFKNLEDGLAVAMGMGARIIEKVYNHPVQLKNFASEDSRSYVQISPEDIKGHYDCEVKLLAEPPEATDIRKGLGMNLRRSGSISQKRELMDYHDMSESEADDELAQIAAEEVMKEPMMREVIGKDAMERMGMDKELEALEEVQKQNVRNIPPNQSKGEVNMDLIRKRGRTGVGVETSETPTEHKVERTLAT